MFPTTASCQSRNPCLMPPCTWPYFILPPFLSLHHGYAHSPFLSLHHGYAHSPSHSNIFSIPLLLTHSFVMTSMPIHQLSYIHSHQTSLKSTITLTTMRSAITLPAWHIHCLCTVHTHLHSPGPHKPVMHTRTLSLILSISPLIFLTNSVTSMAHFLVPISSL